MLYRNKAKVFILLLLFDLHCILAVFVWERHFVCVFRLMVYKWTKSISTKLNTHKTFYKSNNTIQSKTWMCVHIQKIAKHWNTSRSNVIYALWSFSETGCRLIALRSCLEFAADITYRPYLNMFILFSIQTHLRLHIWHPNCHRSPTFYVCFTSFRQHCRNKYVDRKCIWNFLAYSYGMF